MRYPIIMTGLIILGFFLLTLAGCAGGFLDASQIEALGKDPASVCLSIQTPYGTAKFARTNIMSGNVSCDSDGLKVQSDAQKVGVPLLVVPSVTVGPTVVTPR